MKYYIGDGTTDSKIIPMQLNQYYVNIILLFAEYFAKEFKWYDNTKMMFSFINQLEIKYECCTRNNNKKSLIEIIHTLQEYLDKALDERNQVGLILPLPNELVNLIVEYFLRFS